MATVPVSRRDRPTKPPLSRELIIETALDILAREGLAALSMRKAAAALDTGAASLYVYVTDRDHLLRLMVDRVLGEVPLTTPEQGDWQERYIAFARAILDAYGRYPGLASAALGVIPVGENAMRLAEHEVGLFQAAGMSEQAIAWAIDILGLYINAAAVEADIFRQQALTGATEAATIAAAEAAFRALSPERFPHLSRLIPFLVQGGGDDRFTWGLRVLLNGMMITPPAGATVQPT